MSDLVVVKSFGYRHEAELAKSVLTGSGIESTIQADDVGGFRPHLTLTGGKSGMANLLVREEDLERAKEILD